MSHDNVIDLVAFSKAHNLFRRMSYRDMDVGLEGLVRMLGLNAAQRILVVLARLLNHRLRFHRAAELRWAHDRNYVQ